MISTHHSHVLLQLSHTLLWFYLILKLSLFCSNLCNLSILFRTLSLTWVTGAWDNGHSLIFSREWKPDYRKCGKRLGPSSPHRLSRELRVGTVSFCGIVIVIETFFCCTVPRFAQHIDLFLERIVVLFLIWGVQQFCDVFLATVFCCLPTSFEVLYVPLFGKCWPSRAFFMPFTWVCLLQQLHENVFPSSSNLLVTEPFMWLRRNGYNPSLLLPLPLQYIMAPKLGINCRAMNVCNFLLEFHTSIVVLFSCRHSVIMDLQNHEWKVKLFSKHSRRMTANACKFYQNLISQQHVFSHLLLRTGFFSNFFKNSFNNSGCGKKRY